MASAYLVRRAKHGRGYVVRYRLGGRTYPVQHGGTFRTLKEAKIRRDLIAGELAAGRDPAELLSSLAKAPPPSVTVSEWRDRFIASRHDLDVNTLKGYR